MPILRASNVSAGAGVAVVVGAGEELPVGFGVAVLVGLGEAVACAMQVLLEQIVPKAHEG